MKGQCRVLLQRRVGSASLVDALDQLVEVARLIPVTRLELILLRIEIFLGPWPERRVLAELESGVDAVGG